jgi:periplasmic copper chaperone A
MRRRHPIRALVIAALALVVAAPMAAAQVTVDPDGAERGGFATLTFNVPNERDDASTTALEVNRPTDTPIQFVSVQPKPGWEYQVERENTATQDDVDHATKLGIIGIVLGGLALLLAAFAVLRQRRERPIGRGPEASQEPQ